MGGLRSSARFLVEMRANASSETQPAGARDDGVLESLMLKGFLASSDPSLFSCITARSPLASRVPARPALTKSRRTLGDDVISRPCGLGYLNSARARRGGASKDASLDDARAKKKKKEEKGEQKDLDS